MPYAMHSEGDVKRSCATAARRGHQPQPGMSGLSHQASRLRLIEGDPEDLSRSALIHRLAGQVIAAREGSCCFSIQGTALIVQQAGILHWDRRRRGPGAMDESFFVNRALNHAVWDLGQNIRDNIRNSAMALQADVSIHCVVPKPAQLRRFRSSFIRGPLYSGLWLIHRDGVWGGVARVTTSPNPEKPARGNSGTHILKEINFQTPGDCVLVECSRALVEWSDVGQRASADVGYMIVGQADYYVLEPRIVA